MTILLIAHGCTLALKAWEDRQTSNIGALTSLQRTALAVQERLDSRADKILAAMEFLQASGLTVKQITDRYPEIDIIISLKKARDAEQNSRMRIAAETIFRAGDNAGPLFVTRTGDMVLISGEKGKETIAIGTPNSWLPANTGAYYFSLTGPGRIGTGNPKLEAMTTGLQHNDPSILNISGLPRTGVACSSLNTSTVSLCALKPLPLVTSSDLIRSLIYLLLLLAPALAIYGLYRKFSDQTEKVESALRTERDATHLMNLTMEGAQAGFWELRSDTQVITVSDQMARLIGLANGGELDLHRLIDYVFEKDRANVQTAFERAMETRTINVSIRPQHNPRNTWIELSGREVKDHDERYIHLSLIHI